ncbi:MAG: hypothetical protein WDM78_14000 [Puia sp.]
MVAREMGVPAIVDAGMQQKFYRKNNWCQYHARKATKE